MARELHTLNDNEMAMVEEYISAGIADTHEIALQYLLDSGMVSDKVSTKGVYMPEGFAYLKFHNGHQKSKFTQVDKLCKKAKKDSPFELENWYLGAEFPKDESGTILIDDVVKGYEVGQNPELIITHVLYAGKRYNPAKPAESIETTLGSGMNIDQQKAMIDFKSKKSLYDIRQEQIKAYKVATYAEVEKDEKIKFTINIFCLVKTEDGWKKAWFIDTVGRPENNVINDFLDEIKAKNVANPKDKKFLQSFIVTLDTTEDSNNAGSYNRKIIIKEELIGDAKSEVSPLVGDNIKTISKFLADQKESISKANASMGTQQLDPEEDLDESIFE